MSENDVREAVDQLINVAKKRGQISQRAFDKTCEDYLVLSNVVASRFLSKTGKNWNEYKLSAPKNQSDNMVAAMQVARERFELGRDWWDRYKSCTGSVFTSKNRKYVYIGSRLDSDGDMIHHFIRVKDLQTIQADWSDIHKDFHALGDILFQAKAT
jgi:hypothetical protein